MRRWSSTVFCFLALLPWLAVESPLAFLSRAGGVGAAAAESAGDSVASFFSRLCMP